MNSDRLEAFLAVIQHENITKAAEALGLSQPAMSHRISKLEDELGVKLFSKRGRRLELTTKGEELLQYCLQKKEMEEYFLLGFSGDHEAAEATGHIRVGCYSSVQGLLIKTFSEFCKDHPKVTFEVILGETYEMVSMLNSAQADYVLLDAPPLAVNISENFLGNEVYLMCEKKNAKVPEVYIDHDPRDTLTLEYLKHWGNVPSSFMRRFVGSMPALVEALECGLGKGVIPKHILKRSSELKILKGAPELKVPVYLLGRKHLFITPLKRAFEGKIKEVFLKELRQS